MSLVRKRRILIKNNTNIALTHTTPYAMMRLKQSDNFDRPYLQNVMPARFQDVPSVQRQIRNIHLWDPNYVEIVEPSLSLNVLD